MGDTNKEATKTTKKPSFFKGLKREFKKVTWPDKMSVTKQTAAVAVITAIVGLVIALMDIVIQYGVDCLTTF